MSKERYLYLMHCQGTNQYKIGVSNDVEGRRRALQNASGFPVVLVAFYKTKDKAFKVERQLHVLFDKYRTIGEWFEFPESYSLIKFETLCSKYGMTPIPLETLMENPEEAKTIYEKMQEYKPKIEVKPVKLKEAVYPEHIIQLYKDGNYFEYGKAVIEYRKTNHDF